jgi:hypothetical protein
MKGTWLALYGEGLERLLAQTDAPWIQNWEVTCPEGFRVMGGSCCLEGTHVAGKITGILFRANLGNRVPLKTHV